MSNPKQLHSWSLMIITTICICWCMMYQAVYRPPLQPMMMGYRVPYAGGFLGNMPMMRPAAGLESRMPSLSNRMPRPPGAVSSESAMSSTGAAGVVAARASSVASSQSVTTARDSPVQSVYSGAAASGGISAAGPSKSKQGLEKILDTLGKMFPDVQRFVATVLCFDEFSNSGQWRWTENDNLMTVIMTISHTHMSY